MDRHNDAVVEGVFSGAAVHLTPTVDSWLRAVAVLCCLSGCGRLGFVGTPGDNDHPHPADGDPPPSDHRAPADEHSGGDSGGDAPVATETVHIYRSVGPQQTAAIAQGSPGHQVVVSEGRATFNQAVANRIGVGDVLHYDTGGIAGPDQIAFITERISGAVFAVQSQEGRTTLADDGGDTRWAVFRAYTSLADALQGSTNTAVPVAFDQWQAGRDLVAAKEVWHIALYADAEDQGEASTDGWNTTEQNYLHLFTPVGPDQVGVSQRHRGRWGEGYRRRDLIALNTSFVHLDGVAVRREGSAFEIDPGQRGAKIFLSNCYGHARENTQDAVFELKSAATATVWLWNNIAITEAAEEDAHGLNLQGELTLRARNNTVVVEDGDAFKNDTDGGRAHLQNNLLLVNGEGGAIGGSLDTNTSNATNDDKFGDSDGGLSKQDFSFISEEEFDFRLNVSDGGARNKGSAGWSIPSIAAGAWAVDIEGEARTAPWDIGADEFTPP